MGAAAPAIGIPTHCPYCALQCGMILVPSGESVTVVARDFPTNKGGLCRKGMDGGRTAQGSRSSDHSPDEGSKGWSTPSG